MSTTPELIVEVAVAAADMVAGAEVEELLDVVGWDQPGWRVTLPDGSTIDVGAVDEAAARAAVVPHVERELRRAAGVREPTVDRVADLAAAIEKAATPEDGLVAMKAWASDVTPA